MDSDGFLIVLGLIVTFGIVFRMIFGASRNKQNKRQSVTRKKYSDIYTDIYNVRQPAETAEKYEPPRLPLEGERVTKDTATFRKIDSKPKTPPIKPATLRQAVILSEIINRKY